MLTQKVAVNPVTSRTSRKVIRRNQTSVTSPNSIFKDDFHPTFNIVTRTNNMTNEPNENIENDQISVRSKSTLKLLGFSRKTDKEVDRNQTNSYET